MVSMAGMDTLIMAVDIIMAAVTIGHLIDQTGLTDQQPNQ